MVSPIRRLLGLLLVLGLMCAAVAGVGQAADAGPAKVAALATGPEITPDSQATDIASVVWALAGAEDNLIARTRFVNRVRMYSSSRAALTVNSNWSGSIDRLNSLTGRSPLIWPVMQDGMYGYYATELNYGRVLGTSASLGTIKALQYYVNHFEDLE